MLPEEYIKPGALVFFPRETSVNKLPKLYEVFMTVEKEIRFEVNIKPVTRTYLRCRQIDLTDGAPTGDFMNLDPRYCMSFAQGMAGLASRAINAGKRVVAAKEHWERVEDYARVCRGFAVDHFNNGAGHGGPYDE